MNTEITVLIDRIFEHLQQRGLAIADRRRDGLDPSKIKTAVQDLGLQVPGDVLDLYRYCNGTLTAEGETLGEIWFFPGFYWLSLEDMLTVYRAVSVSDQWNKAWLPVFASGGGDFYAVICDKSSPWFGEVVGFVLGEHDQIAEFKSLGKMIEVIERAFSEKAFFLEEGGLKADYPRMRAIAREVQSGFVEHEV